ncbi:hypothetical protein PV326_014432 [Microctonus aethiopoides]|nr:hypothetical protein PV326_014432 [Microctonus aethiopoides]
MATSHHITIHTNALVPSECQIKYKGKFIKKKVLDKRLKSAAAMTEGRKKKRNIKVTEKAHDVLDGARIVDIKELAENLKCRKCGQVISLQDTVNETHLELHSIFHITFPSGKTHKTNDNSSYSDVNTKAVLGSIHAEQGCTALNKILSCLNIPIINSNVYKRYERIVGPAIENAAKDSCRQGALAERKLIIECVDELCQEL